MLALILALVTAISVPAKPGTYVTDKAGVLDPARVKVINEKLAQFERATSDQVLVYVDRSLPPDTTIEQFSNEGMHQWGVGQKGKDNGAVLFLFTGDRKMRIEVGYGLEAVLTDAKSRDITSTIIKPRLQAGDYNGAVEQGVDAILAAARGQEYKGTGRTVHETRSQPHANSPLPCGGIALVIAVVILGIIVLIAKRGSRGGVGGTNITTYGSGPDTSSSFSDTSSSSSSDSGSSSSSDSGFDGGGGDSGGGGASDSW
jgi:uncharacterized protein